MDNSSLINVAGLFGFFIGIPAGIVAGWCGVRARLFWRLTAACFVLGIIFYRAGLGPLFGSLMVVTFWFALSTDLTQRTCRILKQGASREK